MAINQITTRTQKKVRSPDKVRFKFKFLYPQVRYNRQIGPEYMSNHFGRAEL